MPCILCKLLINLQVAHAIAYTCTISTRHAKPVVKQRNPFAALPVSQRGSKKVNKLRTLRKG